MAGLVQPWVESVGDDRAATLSLTFGSAVTNQKLIVAVAHSRPSNAQDEPPLLTVELIREGEGTANRELVEAVTDQTTNHRGGLFWTTAATGDGACTIRLSHTHSSASTFDCMLSIAEFDLDEPVADYVDSDSTTTNVQTISLPASGPLPLDGILVATESIRMGSGWIVINPFINQAVGTEVPTDTNPLIMKPGINNPTFYGRERRVAEANRYAERSGWMDISSGRTGGYTFDMGQDPGGPGSPVSAQVYLMAAAWKTSETPGWSGPVVRSWGVPVSSNNAVVAPTPSVITNDDWIIVFGETRSTEEATFQPSTPGDWTLIDSIRNPSGGAASSLVRAWAARWSTSPDMNWDDPGNHIIINSVAIQDADVSLPIESTTTAQTDTAGTSHSIGATFTVGDERLLLCFAGHGEDTDTSNYANSSLANVFGDYDVTVSGNDATLVWIEGRLATAGTAGTFTWDSTASVRNAGIVVILQPPSSGNDATATGAASFTLTASGAAVAGDPVATGSGSASFTLTASGAASAGTPAATGTGAASFTLTATGAAIAGDPVATAVGAANFGLTAAGTATSATEPTATATGAASFTLTASGSAVAADPVATGTGTATFTLTAAGSAVAGEPSSTATGTAAFTLTATGTAVAGSPVATATGTGTFTLTAAGTAVAGQPSSTAIGAASFTLTASGSAVSVLPPPTPGTAPGRALILPSGLGRTLTAPTHGRSLSFTA